MLKLCLLGCLLLRGDVVVVVDHGVLHLFRFLLKLAVVVCVFFQRFFDGRSQAEEGGKTKRGISLFY